MAVLFDEQHFLHLHLSIMFQAREICSARKVRYFELRLMVCSCRRVAVEQRCHLLSESVIDSERGSSITRHGELDIRGRVKWFGVILAQCKNFRRFNCYLSLLRICERAVAVDLFQTV